ncbi:MAG: hypothetical protein M1823_006132 [Watsoniomyces obsoletus]|nr:MAG: hypothetical protein M1823_006132 [Watsoniomyces obsoletus]
MVSFGLVISLMSLSISTVAVPIGQQNQGQVTLHPDDVKALKEVEVEYTKCIDRVTVSLAEVASNLPHSATAAEYHHQIAVYKQRRIKMCQDQRHRGANAIEDRPQKRKKIEGWDTNKALTLAQEFFKECQAEVRRLEESWQPPQPKIDYEAEMVICHRELAWLRKTIEDRSAQQNQARSKPASDSQPWSGISKFSLADTQRSVGQALQQAQQSFTNFAKPGLSAAYWMNLARTATSGLSHNFPALRRTPI